MEGRDSISCNCSGCLILSEHDRHRSLLPIYKYSPELNARTIRTAHGSLLLWLLDEFRTGSVRSRFIYIFDRGGASCYQFLSNPDLQNGAFLSYNSTACPWANYWYQSHHIDKHRHFHLFTDGNLSIVVPLLSRSLKFALLSWPYQDRLLPRMACSVSSTYPFYVG